VGYAQTEVSKEAAIPPARKVPIEHGNRLFSGLVLVGIHLYIGNRKSQPAPCNLQHKRIGVNGGKGSQQESARLLIVSTRRLAITTPHQKHQHVVHSCVYRNPPLRMITARWRDYFL
jgi:hypothetical protein